MLGPGDGDVDGAGDSDVDGCRVDDKHCAFLLAYGKL